MPAVDLPPSSAGKILFADDDAMVRDGLAALIRRRGFTCVCVSTGAEAIAALEHDDFDALLSDIHMPGNTGLELIESVPALVAGLPVILLTGHPTVETAARSVRLAVAAYLTKPPDMDELGAVLSQAIADHRGIRLMRSGRERLHTWERELAELERFSRKSPGAQNGAMESYLRMTLRQVILALSDVERATASCEQGLTSDERTLERVEHIAALRHTVDVLERTKQNFKSKELADLRHNLEKLLRRQDNFPAAQI